jgi:hypothetical protein
VEEKQITIAATLSGSITLASQQNAVPVIRDLSVVNDTLQTLENLKLEFFAKPDFVAKKTWHIDRIAPESTVYIRDIDVALNGQLLNELSEAISGEAFLSLCKGEEVVAETRRDIRLLARNEWGGAGQMADLLAAFSMPNDPAVDRVLKAASLVLQRAGKNGAVDGYKSGARTRTWEMVSAIWSAISGMGLSYALPPASFESQGQKIRTPTQIVESGLATCLDLTLLFTAAIEQAGLNPFVVFTKGHAFAGVWLQPEQFSSLLIDDPSVIRKRAILNELVAFETTLVTQKPPVSFAASIDHAKQQLGEDKEGEFELVVDIRRARMQKIRPLPAFGSLLTTEQQKTEDADAATVGLDLAPNLPNFDTETTDNSEAETPQTRLAQWQRQLLDLSLRNPLLNFQSTKGSVKLVTPDPAILEDRLAQGKKIKISPAPEIADGKSQRSAAIHMARHSEDIDEMYAQEALNRDEVLVKLPSEELDTRVTNIYRTAKKDLEEGGANTLFIAIGFLVWKREGTDDRKFRAPLILLPVTLERKSVRGGVRMSLGEDEPRFNTTLLQMLRQDFELDIKGLDDALPQDAHGVDVAGIWRRVREEIKDEPGFEVVEDVVLGTFSFAKYLMWKDLVDRTDQLKLNPVVKHLIETPREVYANNIAFPHQRELDSKYPPERVFTPLPTDSSQLAAIMASAAGKDFVLIGPPGTGKSQTIANMIAHNLAEGRKVLFVAEKVTALNVVYRRLKKLGLGDFCLELHSNKAKKAEVIDQLRSAWASKGEFSESEWKREAARLKSLRDDLGNYVNRIHAKYRNGLTPYLAIGQVIANENIPIAKLSWPSLDQHSQEDLDQLREIADRLDENYRIVRELRLCGVGVVQAKDWSPVWERNLIEVSKEVSATARELAAGTEKLLVALQVDLKHLTKTKLDALAALARSLPQAYGLDLKIAFLPDAQAKFEKFKQSLDEVDEYHAASSRLSCVYADLPWRALDVNELEKTFIQSQESFWLKGWLLRRQISSILRKNAGGKGKPDIANDLNVLKELRDLGEHIEAVQLEGAALPGWSGYQSDTTLGRKALDIAISIRRSLTDYAETHDELALVRDAVHRVVNDGNEMLADTASIGKACRHYEAAYVAYNEAFGKFRGLAECGELTENNNKDCLVAIQQIASDIQSQEQRLNAWCAWQRVKTEANLAGLGNFVSLLENESIQDGQALTAFEKSYADWWIDAVVEQDAVLRSFVSVEHERRIKVFAELDDKFTELTAKYVRAKLCGALPAEDDAKKGTELGVLRRELEKKRAHKPLRQLIAEMPSALTQIVPCLLMSPLSIAQYLAAEQSLFDLIIFDEASQITVWDAIGAISRGRSVVVVGDPQQLPPTTFFSRKDDEINASEDVEQDLSSILDECLGAGLPRLELNWHYRSKYESLIAFSNQRFYRGNLVTFPSPVTEDRAVRLVPVPDGLYDRGRNGSHTNRIEAEAVVAEILKRLKDPIFLAKEHSIGVVTFNSQQQQLIEDLLDAARKDNPELDRFFDEAIVDEPVFVKNLESVQGDERDVMLFSITYGPDKTGAPPKMNFGPLNQQGGPRRLNVAVTRARHEMLVFATLKPDQIDLSRTNAAGVRDLKHFLELAERGPRALVELDQGSIGGYESPFEEAVAKRLADLGWHLLPQIGVSAFRIDLGVVHPDAPGKFLAGIECDGATYHRSATVRDRDKLRERVLRGLGWDIVRVWSTDWWIDANSAVQKIHGVLKEKLDASRQRPTS